MIFSQRYHKALKEKKLLVEIPDESRSKIIKCLEKNNHSSGINYDPNNQWISTIIEETILEWLNEYGVDEISESNEISKGNYHSEFQFLITNYGAASIFDFIEIAMKHMERDNRENCRIKINQIFDIHECPWRISDGEFFKLDANFMGERLSANAHDALAANTFTGAAQEFAKARQLLGANEVKDSILYAGKSFESVMKVMTGLNHANADKLIQAMLTQGYFDDLPDGFKSGFGEQVLKTLPTMRNKLSGHGQGSDIIEIPAAYGELSIQLAAAFHNFLITKHLERKPKEPVKSFLDDVFDEVCPF